MFIRLHTGSGENAAGILEENLADLQEVEGHVAIFFSPSLVSLHMLKNLARNRGNSVYGAGYVCYFRFPPVKPDSLCTLYICIDF